MLKIRINVFGKKIIEFLLRYMDFGMVGNSVEFGGVL